MIPIGRCLLSLLPFFLLGLAGCANTAEIQRLEAEVAALHESVAERDVRIRALLDRVEKLGEVQLLLAAAETHSHGTEPAPDLSGSVVNVKGRLLTVKVAKNPEKVDIQRVINRLPFRFAIFDAKGVYKGDAVAQKYEPTAKSVLCKLIIKQEDAVIAVGDVAATNP